MEIKKVLIERGAGAGPIPGRCTLAVSGNPANGALSLALASFPVLPCTQFTCDNCGGETGKAWSETSREVDVVQYI